MSVPSLTLFALLCLNLMVSKETVAASSISTPVWCSRDSQFYCHKSDECKPSHVRCDGTQQCDQGEDEEDCLACTSATAAGLDRFYCQKSDTCIFLEWKCDGSPDCPDDEDEENCDIGEITCSANQFDCGKGQCIDANWRCDNQHDCQSGLDEEQCEPTCAPHEFTCTPHGAQGHFSNVECVSALWQCDGEEDCANGEDEKNCGKVECAADRFNCSAEKKCMPRTWMCDGDTDCLSGEDEAEADCPEVPEAPVITRLCTDKEFKCVSGDTPCIISAWRCDEQSDCADGSDEVGCPDEELSCNSAEFKCADKSRCIPRFLICSGASECADDSDEQQAACHSDEKIPCHLSQGRFPCLKAGLVIETECLTMDLLCNGKYDCPNGRDEDDSFCGGHPESDLCSSVNITDECGEGPLIVCNNIHTNLEENQNRTVGYMCSCKKKGYDYVNKQCYDRDECKDKENPVCDQICINEVGSYKCECLEGYILSADGRSCLVNTTVHPKLLFTNRHQIRSIHIHGQGNYMPLVDTKSAVALDFDYSTKEVFYSDVEKQKLYKFKLPAFNSEDDLHEEDLNIPGVQTPDGLAYDWIYKHLYWTDTSSNTINMACVDEEKESKNSKVIYENQNPDCTDLSADELGTTVCIDEPRALALHPRKGWVFWSDWGNKPHIMLAALDGSHMEMIAYNRDSDKQYLYWPNGLTLDLSSDNERLYWIDALLHSIFSCTINRCITDINLLVYNTDNIKHPFSITVFENKLYWTDWTHKHIVSANKYTGGNITRILDNLEQPMDLKVYHPMSQQQSTNHCEPDAESADVGPVGPLCEQICVPKPWSRMSISIEFSPLAYTAIKYTCLCSSGYLLNLDGRTCSRILPSVEPIKQTAVDSGMSVGIIAAIASSCILLMCLITAVVVALVLRIRRQRTNKDMNFDNPIYKRTTEDKLELPRHEYQPSHTDPTASVPLTSSEGSSGSQEDYDV